MILHSYATLRDDNNDKVRLVAFVEDDYVGKTTFDIMPASQKAAFDKKQEEKYQALKDRKKIGSTNPYSFLRQATSCARR